MYSADFHRFQGRFFVRLKPRLRLEAIFRAVMPVVRLMQSLVSETALPGPPLGHPAPPHFSMALASTALVRSFGLEGDAERVRQLAQAVQDTGDVAPRGAGLLAETVSRPHRRVEAWLALPDACPGGHRPGQPGPELLGLVTLVAGRSAAGERASIAWLLVRPEARRSGIGRLLVGQACRRARDQGAREIEVECRSDWQGAIAFWEAVGFRRLSADRAGS
jgi:ribosomal protein S18 acetylase RimI-like enzyme